MGYTSSMFVGVDEGYGVIDLPTKFPFQAVKAVRKMLGHKDYETYPGIAVYHPDWSAQQGLEVCSVVLSKKDDFKSFLTEAEELRSGLKQATIGVASLDGVYGFESVGFVTLPVKFNFKELAKSWQSVATEVYDEFGNDFYNSACVYQTREGAVVQAEANPMDIECQSSWADRVDRISHEVSEKHGLRIEPVHRSIGFVDLEHIRGEQQEVGIWAKYIAAQKSEAAALQERK